MFRNVQKKKKENEKAMISWVKLEIKTIWKSNFTDPITANQKNQVL